jgi:hypothetical protein
MPRFSYPTIGVLPIFQKFLEGRFTRRCGDPLCEGRYYLFELRLFDHCNRPLRLNPLNQALLNSGQLSV